MKTIPAWNDTNIPKLPWIKEFRGILDREYDNAFGTWPIVKSPTKKPRMGPISGNNAPVNTDYSPPKTKPTTSQCQMGIEWDKSRLIHFRA